MRIRAEFFDRSSMYIQGILTDIEALRMFQVLGIVKEMRIYKDGRRILVYEHPEGWIL